MCVGSPGRFLPVGGHRAAGLREQRPRGTAVGIGTSSDTWRLKELCFQRTQGNKKDKDGTEGKRARTGTKVYTSLHLGNCLFNKTDCKCFRDLRWVTSSLMWPLKFNMLPRNLTLSIRTQILIGSHATAGGQATAP